MGSLTCSYHSTYPPVRDIITERKGRTTSVRLSLRCRRHEIGMNRDARDHFYVGIHASNERSLLVEFLACTGGDTIENIGDIEQMKVESGGCNSQGRLLVLQRIQYATNRLLMRLGCQMVGSGQFRRPTRRCCRDRFFQEVRLGGSLSLRKGGVPSIGGCNGHCIRRSLITSLMSPSI
jgi:hypothetical protein